MLVEPVANELALLFITKEKVRKGSWITPTHSNGLPPISICSFLPQMVVVF